MNEIFCSCRGESATTWLDKPKTQRSKLPWPAVKILYPSYQTVKDSHLGFPVSASLCIGIKGDCYKLYMHREAELCSAAGINGKRRISLASSFMIQIAKEGRSLCIQRSVVRTFLLEIGQLTAQGR